MVSMVFGVLFGFRRSDFRSSDYLPNLGTEVPCYIMYHRNIYKAPL